MLEAARKIAPGGKFKQMDMLDLKLPLHSFDGIWCCASLLHVKKTKAGKALQNFRKVLREEGIIFISLKEGAGEMIKKYPDGTKRFFASYSMSEIKELISANDLEVVKSYKNTNDPDGDIWLSIFCKLR